MLKLLHYYFNHLNFPQVKIFVYLYLRPYSRILADIMQITTDFIHACKEFYRAWITLITHLNVVVHCCLRRVALHCWTPLWALFYVWLRGDNFSLSLLFCFFSMTTFSTSFPSLQRHKSISWWQLSAVGMQNWGFAGAYLRLYIYPC